MFDQRQAQIIDLTDSDILKEGAAFKYVDKATGKELVVKLIADYKDEDDAILLAEFRKLALLSSEPEIATVYFLAKSIYKEEIKSCYVMDFVYGYDLDEFIQTSEHIDYYNLFSIIKQIATGLEKAHHYDIFHNDLHNKNIRVNTLGYVKIIDFLWRDTGASKVDSANKDINDFKRIVVELCAKCLHDEVSRIEYLSGYCQRLSSFTGVSDKLKELDSISFDLGLLTHDSIDILSKLLQESEAIPNSMLMLNVIVLDDERVPEIYIPPLTDEEQEFLNSNRKNDSGSSRLRYLDSRIDKVQHNIRNQLLIKLTPLKNLNLINWRVVVKNQGEAFVGPYLIKLQISLTSKIAYLMRANRSMSLINPTDSTLEHLLLGTPIDEIPKYERGEPIN